MRDDGFSGKSIIFVTFLTDGELAQLARAFEWHSKGRRFDSDILHERERFENPSRSLLFALDQSHFWSRTFSERKISFGGTLFFCNLDPEKNEIKWKKNVRMTGNS